MKSAYRILAYLISLLVVVQAMTIAFAMFGLGKWIEEGGVLDQATMESGEPTFPEGIGFFLHFLNGQMLIPLIAIILLIVSFFAKVPGGVKWAGFILLAIVVQILLGIFGHGAPVLGLLHGLNALVIFTLALYAARRATAASATVAEERVPA